MVRWRVSVPRGAISRFIVTVVLATVGIFIRGSAHAADPAVFVTDSSSSSYSLARVRNGEATFNLISPVGTFAPRGVAVDVYEGVAYVVNGFNTGTIESIPLLGGSSSAIASGFTASPTDLDIDGDYIYALEPSGTIKRVLKSGGSVSAVVSATSLSAIEVFDGWIYFVEFSSPDYILKRCKVDAPGATCGTSPSWTTISNLGSVSVKSIALSNPTGSGHVYYSRFGSDEIVKLPVDFVAGTTLGASSVVYSGCGVDDVCDPIGVETDDVNGGLYWVSSASSNEKLMQGSLDGSATPVELQGLLTTPQYVAIYSHPGTGDGTSLSPFLISSCKEFNGLNALYKSEFRIASAVTTLSCGSSFIKNPIAKTGAFEGTLDGNGKILADLNISSTGGSGLFGTLQGTVENLHVRNALISGGTRTGGIAGHMSGDGTDTKYGRIIGSSFTGMVRGVDPGSDASAGGLVGYVSGGVIDASWSSAYVLVSQASGNTNNVGGLVGAMFVSNDRGQIFDSFASGNVEAYSFGGGAAGQVGGLVGTLYKNSGSGVLEVRRSFSSGSVLGKNTIGGLIGYADNNLGQSFTIEDCFTTGYVKAAPGGSSIGAAVGALGGFTSTSYFSNVYFNPVAAVNASSCDGEGNTYLASECDAIGALFQDAPSSYFHDSTSDPLDQFDFSVSGPWLECEDPDPRLSSLPRLKGSPDFSTCADGKLYIGTDSSERISEIDNDGLHARPVMLRADTVFSSDHYTSAVRAIDLLDPATVPVAYFQMMQATSENYLEPLDELPLTRTSNEDALSLVNSSAAPVIDRIARLAFYGESNSVHLRNIELSTDNSLSLGTSRFARRLAVDPVHRRLYYYEEFSGTNSIKMVSYDTAGFVGTPIDIVTGLIDITGLDFDTAGSTLYWMENGAGLYRQTVDRNTGELSGTLDTLLVITGVASAGLEVDSSRGAIYFGSRPTGTSEWKVRRRDIASSAITDIIRRDSLSVRIEAVRSYAFDEPSTPASFASVPSAMVVGTQTPGFTGTADPDTRVVVHARDVTSFGSPFEYLSAAVPLSGNWTASGGAPLIDGHVYEFFSTSVDESGNESLLSSPLEREIDVTPPSQPTANGPIATNDSTPALFGACETGTDIELWLGNPTVVGSALLGTTICVAGSWGPLEAPSPLLDGLHLFFAVSTDIAGNESTSVGTNILVDTVAPPAAAISSISGFTFGRPVNTSSPTVGGTRELGTSVSVFEGATLLGADTGRFGTTWSVALPARADGLHILTTTATDAAGNSTMWSSYDLEVDTIAPGPPTITFPANGSSTNNRLPVIAGRVPEGNIDVDVSVSGGALVSSLGGSAAAKASGDFSYPLGVALPEQATYSIAAVSRDRAGNLSSSVTITLTVGCGEGSFGELCKKCPGFNAGAICGGNGTCRTNSGRNNLAVCECAQGFAGAGCTRCDNGYFGTSCAICPGDGKCSGHGACADGKTGTGTCSCDAGWSGADCSTCAPGRYGSDCSRSCPSDGGKVCGGHGSCDEGVFGSGSCACDPGFFGARCSREREVRTDILPYDWARDAGWTEVSVIGRGSRTAGAESLTFDAALSAWVPGGAGPCVADPLGWFELRTVQLTLAQVRNRTVIASFLRSDATPGRYLDKVSRKYYPMGTGPCPGTFVPRTMHARYVLRAVPRSGGAVYYIVYDVSLDRGEQFDESPIADAALDQVGVFRETDGLRHVPDDLGRIDARFDQNDVLVLDLTESIRGEQRALRAIDGEESGTDAGVEVAVPLDELAAAAQLSADEAYWFGASVEVYGTEAATGIEERLFTDAIEPVLLDGFATVATSPPALRLVRRGTEVTAVCAGKRGVPRTEYLIERLENQPGGSSLSVTRRRNGVFKLRTRSRAKATLRCSEVVEGLESQLSASASLASAKTRTR